MAALVAAGALAAVVVAAPVVVANHGNPDIDAGEAEMVEPYAVGRHVHDPRAQARADAARRSACADPAERRRRPAAACPAYPSEQLGTRTTEAGYSIAVEEGVSTSALATDGTWSAPFDMPLVGETHVVLPTGKLLLMGPGTPRSANTSRAFLYDPTTGALKRVDPPVNPATGFPYNLWCSGQAVLANGSVLFAGGNLAYRASGTQWKGLDRLFTFNPWTETWIEQSRMAKGRWYPTLVPMADGRVVIYGGWDHTGTNTYQRDIEVFTPSGDPGGRGTLALKRSTRNPGLYSQMTVLPGGDILHAGPREADRAILDTGTWGWRSLSRVDRRYWGSHVVMHEGAGRPHRMLRVGGANSTTKAVERRIGVIDLNDAKAAQTFGPSLVTARAHLNTVVLPDGALLTVGGGVGQGSTGSLYADPVYTTEILSPGASAWRVVGRQVEERTYHSAASLLPDGRVFSSGDDRAGIAASDADRAEIYSPPYLFRGARPAITAAPSAVPYGADFAVSSPQAAAIRRAVLIAPVAVTHSTDMAQRSVVIQAAGDADGLTLTAPSDPSIAPPGYYQLFLVDDTGVPSEARWIRLGDSATTTPTTNQAPVADFSVSPSSPVVGESVSFTDTSTDADGSIASRAWDLDDDGSFDDGTGAGATRSFAAEGSYTVRLRVTDDGGASATTSRTVSVTATTTDGEPVDEVSIPAGNLTVNPSFEVDLTGWKTFNSALSRVTAADAPHGGAAVEVSYTGGTSFAIDDRADPVTSTVAGQAYTARAYVRAASASSVGKTARIFLREKTQSNALVKDTGSTAVVLTSAFQPVSVTLTPTAGGNRLDVRVSQLGASSGNAFLADAITLVMS